MRNRAFSLIEIAVVVALVVMIGGLVFPALSSRVGAERVSAVSREVASLGLIARGEAARSESGVSLYLLMDDDGHLHAGITHGTDIEASPRERVYSFPAGWSVSHDEHIESTSSPGSADEPIMLALYLPDGTVAAANAGVRVARDDVSLRISASSVTGEISVEQVTEAGSDAEHDAESDTEIDQNGEFDEDPESLGLAESENGGRE